jgi:hypothetical protein
VLAMDPWRLEVIAPQRPEPGPQRRPLVRRARASNEGGVHT